MVILEKIGQQTEPAEHVELAEPTVEEPVEPVEQEPVKSPVEPVEQAAVKPTVSFAAEPKKRGRPRKNPVPKAEPQTRGRPPKPPPAPDPVPAPVPAPVPVPTFDTNAYNQHLIQALIAHNNASTRAKQAKWSSLVRF